jgi:hypothetical protein
MGEQPTSKSRYDLPDWDGMNRDLKEYATQTRSDLSENVASGASDYRFTDTRPLARWLIGALVVGMISRGAGLGTTWVMRGWFNGDARPTESAYETIELLTVGAAMTTLIASAVAGILWVVWLWYAYSNLPSLRRPVLYKKFTVWLSWLVPIWSLFRPKQIHNEVWRSGGDDGAPVWFQLWWFLFVAVILSMNAQSSTVFTWADVIANGIGIMASIPAIAVIWISATRQLNKRHAQEGTSERPLGVSAKYAPTGIGLFSFALAALLIVMPHSEDLPEGTRAGGFLDIEPGECFVGDETQGLGLIWIVDCSTPHIGEAVGAVEVDATSYPGVNTLSEFGTFGCWSAFYEYAGDTADNLDYRLDWYSPLGASWNEGYSSIVCTVTHVDGTRLSASIADPKSRWIALERLREGSCYDFHQSLVAAAELPCSNGGVKLGTVKRYTTDPLVEFPGEGRLNDDLSCLNAGTLGPILPTSETWPLGDRVSLCISEVPLSA